MGAQFGIDELILKNLGKDKVFVEAGGSHPDDQNNTSLLEKFGWSGLIVEPKLLYNDLYYLQVPGVPIMFIKSRKYSIERMPEAFGAPKV